jgi:hypothetical protein
MVKENRSKIEERHQSRNLSANPGRYGAKPELAV